MTTTKTRLHQLFEEQGQSPWIDDLKRSYLAKGELQQLVDRGIRGVTSNPTILQKAIEGSNDYDEQFRGLTGISPVDAYWEMAITDVTGACDLLRPLHDSGGDGWVSLEVAPSLAHDTDGTIEAARNLHERIRRPNLFVKIPATEAGIPAIKQMVSEGRNINITLIFSLSRYDQVVEAYLSGLEAFAAGGGDVSRVNSVASFFVSRVDTEVDKRLEKIGENGLGGKAAVAQAKLAYQLFMERFSGPRWETLKAKGAHVQRPLWASTSTKNPDYPDLLYVDNLIGPDTVNTMPLPTIDAFLDHGTLTRSVDEGVAEARDHLDRLAKAGIDLADVAQLLEDQGVANFANSFDDLIRALTDKAAVLARS